MANRLHQPHVPLPEIHWSPNEQWVWRKLRRGEVADFNEKYGVFPTPWEDEAWNEKEKARRLIRPEFLYTILLHEPWRSALSNWGVRLGGAYFPEPIEMPMADVINELWLVGCRIENGLLLYDAHFAHRLVINRSFVNGPAYLQGLRAGGALVMDRSRLGETTIKRAHLEGDFSAYQTKFENGLNMDWIKVDGSVFMAEARCEELVQLTGARVGGLLNMNQAFLGEKLFLNQAQLRGGLFMSDSHFEKSIQLEGVLVRGSVDMGHAFFGGGLAMERAEIQGDLIMRRSRFTGEARLNGLRVSGPVVMTDSIFSLDLDMTGATIQGALVLRMGAFRGMVRLSDSKVQGALLMEGASFYSLGLSDVQVELVCDGMRPDGSGAAWPQKLAIDHFVYNNLCTGVTESSFGEITERSVDWIKNWLSSHRPFSPQPYEQCAKVLRSAGEYRKASEVLYSGKERERLEPDGKWGRWLLLTASRLLLGHGIGWRFVVVPSCWALLFILLGSFFVFYAQPDNTHSYWWALTYSLSKIIPLAYLGSNLQELYFGSFWTNAYFILQTLYGWFFTNVVLVAILAAVAKMIRFGER